MRERERERERENLRHVQICYIAILLKMTEKPKKGEKEHYRQPCSFLIIDL
jgi:hypothetical protein